MHSTSCTLTQRRPKVALTVFPVLTGAAVAAALFCIRPDGIGGRILPVNRGYVGFDRLAAIADRAIGSLR